MILCRAPVVDVSSRRNDKLKNINCVYHSVRVRQSIVSFSICQRRTRSVLAKYTSKRVGPRVVYGRDPWRRKNNRTSNRRNDVGGGEREENPNNRLSVSYIARSSYHVRDITRGGPHRTVVESFTFYFGRTPCYGCRADIRTSTTLWPLSETCTLG